MTTDEKKYIVVCYMKITIEDGGDLELMSKNEAKMEAEQMRLMQPENIYRIEEFDDDEFDDVVP